VILGVFVNAYHGFPPSRVLQNPPSSTIVRIIQLVCPHPTMARRTVKINRDPQRDLLGDVVSEPGARLRHGVASSRVFIAPKRHELFIGNTRFDEHLEQAGLSEPLKVAALLQSYDWSEFEARYASSGRAPYAPEAMVGVILYGTMQGISSLRTLEKFARTDLGCLWVSGGICPDHTSIGRFIVQHHESFSGELFEQITAGALQATRSDGKSLAGDGTVVEASCSHYGLLHEEAIRANAETKKKASEKEPNNARLKAVADLAQQAEQCFDERKVTRLKKGESTATLVLNPLEPDAVVQRQKRNRGSSAAYKPSILANDKRVIVAHAVDPSNEVSVVAGLLEQSRRVSGDEVETLMLDGGYYCESVLQTAVDQDINLLCSTGKERRRGKGAKKFAKHQFHYDTLNDEYVCPAGELLKPGPVGQKTYVMYQTRACQACSLRDQCTSAKEGRRIRRVPGDELKEAQREVMSHPGAKQAFKQRAVMVEPVFGYLQQVQGLTRFKRKGLFGVRLEFAIHASANNLKRAVAALIAATAVFISLLWLSEPLKQKTIAN